MRKMVLKQKQTMPRLASWGCPEQGARKLSHHASLEGGGQGHTGRVPKEAGPIPEKVGCCSLSELLVAGEEHREGGPFLSVGQLLDRSQQTERVRPESETVFSLRSFCKSSWSDHHSGMNECVQCQPQVPLRLCGSA